MTLVYGALGVQGWWVGVFVVELDMLGVCGYLCQHVSVDLWIRCAVLFIGREIWKGD